MARSDFCTVSPDGTLSWTFGTTGLFARFRKGRIQDAFGGRTTCLADMQKLVPVPPSDRSASQCRLSLRPWLSIDNLGLELWVLQQTVQQVRGIAMHLPWITASCLCDVFVFAASWRAESGWALRLLLLCQIARGHAEENGTDKTATLGKGEFSCFQQVCLLLVVGLRAWSQQNSSPLRSWRRL